MNDESNALFLEAIEHAQREFYIDAIEVFRNLIENNPRGPLADDATYNLGLCYLNINQLEKARENFDRVLSDYGDGLIDPVPEQKEFGRTAAKALFALVKLALLENDRSQAGKYIEKLKNYSDSWVIQTTNSGETKISFHELAKALLEHFDPQPEGSELRDSGGNDA